MANPITRGFRKLTQFSGRDTRGEFWPYAGVVFALVTGIGVILVAILMALQMTRMIADILALFAAHPEAATGQSLPTDHPVTPVPGLGLFFTAWRVLILIGFLLLAAAVVRRLHDRNKAAFWGLMPVPFIGITMTVMPGLATSTGIGQAPSLALFGLLFLNNVLYLITLATLIVILARRGTPGANRYGPAKTSH